MEDNSVAEKEEYKAIGLCGFYSKLFEKEEGVGGLRENIIMRLVIEIDIRSQRVRNVYSKKYQTSSLGNMLGAFYWQLPMGINDTG